MSTFELKVITPDGVMFDGEAESIFARTVMGDVLILPRHINYLTVIENGMVKIKADGAERRAACSDGFLSVADGKVRLAATTFEFADDIELERAERAKKRAEEAMAHAQGEKEMCILEMKLKRALVRISVSKEN